MNLNKIKDFFKKYKVLIILGVLIIFLIFSSTSPKKNQNEEGQKNISTITPTLTPNTEQDNQLVDSGDTPLAYMLPHEEDDFKVIKYAKPGVLLVQAKTEIKTAKVSLKKWLDLVEDKPGENIIVWQ